jgi:4-hydroxybutyrate CoA-transferase
MLTSAEKAVEVIKSGDNVFVHTAVAAPQKLIQAMVNRAEELRNVSVVSLHTEGAAPCAEPELSESFKVMALFVDSNVRKAAQEGRGSYIPIFLSEAPLLFRRGIIPINVALISVSPPDVHGYCSLGTSVDMSRAAEESADYVIAEVNRFMPRTHGDGVIHVSHIDAMVENDSFLPEVIAPEPDEISQAIGKNVAELIEDGATLQMDIGAIPNAVLNCLDNHKELGVHTEMFSVGLLKLLKKGAITGSKKNKHKRKIISSFVMGSQEL